ncbi:MULTISPECIES: hypothetical protein [unclassified Paenibacillus]|uniref:hypothetical protein n=1 Tax=unclassified Paenibacillus TaxID=185978 RepID=UPI00105148A9|nr:MULTISPECIES: hypothetical protein [unclassified Paenibacillus]NIK67351.1 hypothetical protein [Paenibacillus sp. BK720]TCN01389.1 hypothetical protein EV294_101844 [Paenibacillus sp. BK033]
MRLEEHQISELYNSLAAAEQDELIRLLSKAFKTEISLMQEALASMPLEQLMPMRDIVRGYVLTKKNVPSIMDAYTALDTGKLPRKISFGRGREPADHAD